MMTLRTALRRLRRPTAGVTGPRAPLPPDPRAILAPPIDPVLVELRASLLPQQNRLWLRRLVRRAWLALAAVVVAELVVWTIARFVPLQWAPVIGAALPLLGFVAWLVAGVRARPGIGETALAVDVEGRLGDRLSSALELAVEFPASSGPAEDPGTAEATSKAADQDAETDRFVRRQRRDALAASRVVPPGLFGVRLSRAPAASALVAALLLAPVLLLPNPQDAVIAQQQQQREAAERQADRIDKVAEDLESLGEETNDPRTQLAEELRELALQLRQHPD